MQLNVTFTPAAPSDGAVFHALEVIITDSTGNVVNVTKYAAQVNSEKIDNGDGTYTVPVVVTGLAFGPYTGRVLSLDASGNLMGVELEISGDATIEDGANWFPQAISAA